MACACTSAVPVGASKLRPSLGMKLCIWPPLTACLLLSTGCAVNLAACSSLLVALLLLPPQAARNAAAAPRVEAPATARLLVNRRCSTLLQKSTSGMSLSFDYAKRCKSSPATGVRQLIQPQRPLHVDSRLGRTGGIAVPEYDLI